MRPPIDYKIPRRLIGRYLTDPPIELLRETPSSLLTESAIHAVTGLMGPGWDLWIESPFNIRNGSAAAGGVQ